MNQRFYTSRQWRQLRSHIIVRDNGCDLAVPGFEMPENVHIHHMNPMTTEDIVQGDPGILDPEFLISTSHITHNAIHYGDANQVPRQMVERTPGDTKLW